MTRNKAPKSGNHDADAEVEGTVLTTKALGLVNVGICLEVGGGLVHAFVEKAP